MTDTNSVACWTEEKRRELLVKNRCVEVIEGFFYYPNGGHYDHNRLYHFCTQENFANKYLSDTVTVVAGQVKNGKCDLCGEEFERNFLDRVLLFAKLGTWK